MALLNATQRGFRMAWRKTAQTIIFGSKAFRSLVKVEVLT